MDGLVCHRCCVERHLFNFHLQIRTPSNSHAPNLIKIYEDIKLSLSRLLLYLSQLYYLYAATETWATHIAGIYLYGFEAIFFRCVRNENWGEAFVLRHVIILSVLLLVCWGWTANINTNRGRVWYAGVDEQAGEREGLVAQQSWQLLNKSIATRAKQAVDFNENTAP